MAALCMAGDSEWVTGSPTTANSLVPLATGTGNALAQEPVDRLGDEDLQLVVGAAVIVELAPERVLDFGLVTLAADVGAQQVRLPLPAQRFGALEVVLAHAEDEVGAVHH